MWAFCYTQMCTDTCTVNILYLHLSHINHKTNIMSKEKLTEVKPFKTHNDDIDQDGGHYQGRIQTDYQNLCRVFGEPQESGYKSDAEWYVKFDIGVEGYIYNWKNGKNYLGCDGMSVEDIYTWNVGGMESGIVRLIKDALKRF